MTFPDGIEALIGHPNDYYDLVLCEGELLKAVDDGYDINTFGNRTACNRALDKGKGQYNYVAPEFPLAASGRRS